jgi:hypothetical protein
MSTSAFHHVRHHDIDASSSGSESEDLFESSEDGLHQPASLSRALLPVIPDLRFEQSYLKSIKGFVHVEEGPQERGIVEGKGKGKEGLPQGAQVLRDVDPIVDSSHHLVRIDWSKVAWITTRDQVISPLLQGALW